MCKTILYCRPMHLKELFSLINKNVDDNDKKQKYYKLVREALETPLPHTLDEFMETLDEDAPLFDEWQSLYSDVLDEDGWVTDDSEDNIVDDHNDEEEDLRDELNDLQLEQMLFLKRLDDLTKQYALQVKRFKRVCDKL
jgi:hypothetical protein